MLKCKNDTMSNSCKSVADIDNYVSNLKIQALFVNVNMNLASYGDSIEFFVDEPLNMNLDSNREK